MSSPSELLKVNHLVMKHLHFESVRGDLQEGHGCAFRCQYLLFPLPIPFFPSTKSRFLCAFCLRNPHFRAFRAQNQGFCALLGFSGISSTKSRFLCAFGVWNPCFRAFRAQNRHFCVRMGEFSEIFGRFDTKMGFLCSGSITMVVPANHRAHFKNVNPL